MWVERWVGRKMGRLHPAFFDPNHTRRRRREGEQHHSPDEADDTMRTTGKTGSPKASNITARRGSPGATFAPPEASLPEAGELHLNATGGALLPLREPGWLGV